MTSIVIGGRVRVDCVVLKMRAGSALEMALIMEKLGRCC
jgi:hypothetical protein